MHRPHLALLVPALVALLACTTGCRQFTGLLYAPSDPVEARPALPDMGPVPDPDIVEAVPPPPMPLGRGTARTEPFTGPRSAGPAPGARPPRTGPGMGTATGQPAVTAEAPETPTTPARSGDAAETSHVTVEHILVSFDGVELDGVTRSRDEARRLAQNVLGRARDGEDFQRLIQLHTDDLEHKGAFEISNWGVTRRNREVAPRSTVVKAFGIDFAAAAFTSEPGRLVFIEQDPKRAPMGFHILRRIR